MKQYVHDRIKFKEGKEERDLEIVKNGLEKNISIKTISDLTGLSTKDIDAIKQKVEAGICETVCT